jgi:two-component system chemotaxis response regulator CheY
MSKEEKKPSVLVIEDNEMFRKLAIDMLSSHKVYSANTVTDGIAKFKQHQPDITFIDIELPDGRGHEILNAIKLLNPNAFMIMLTASNLENDVKESLKNGARGYIVKPFSRQKIKESIEKYHVYSLKLEKQKL